MPFYGPLQRRSQEDAYKWDQGRKRRQWWGDSDKRKGWNAGGQSRNYPPYRSLQFYSSVLNVSSVPNWDIIFSKTRNSDKNGNYTSSLFQARIVPHPRPCTLFPSTSSWSPAILIVFEGRKNTGCRGETPWFIDAPRSTRGPIITKVINNLRCLSGAWEYTSFDIPIVIRYYLRSPHRTREQLTIVTPRSIMIIIVGDQAQADASCCARVNK